MIKKGFTFIEVIIIFTIVFIMTAILLGTSYKDRSKKEIETIAREVSATIRETQNNALTGKQVDNDRMPCAFKFKIFNEQYQVFRSVRGIDTDCPPDTDSGIVEQFSKLIHLPKKMQLGSIAVRYNNEQITNANNVIFLVPYGDFIVTEKNNDSTDFKGIDFYVFKDNAENEKYHICVHATGLIEEIGFNPADLACSF